MTRRVILFLLILPVCLFGQLLDYNIQIKTFPALTQLDFAGFIITDNMQGTPDVFTVTFNPPPGHNTDMIRIYGQLFWKDVGASDYTRLVEFTTKPFRVRDFKNSDLGNTITLQNHHENTNLIQKNLDKGKPTGAYYMLLQVKSPVVDVVLGQAARAEMSFENPTQTISLIYPTPGLSLDAGNVVAIWTGVQGITGGPDSYYFVRASERKFPGQSLEDALRSGVPFIDDQKITGNLTSVNLRSLPFNREWTIGQEIVLQVGAHVSGIGGGSNLYSQPVSFVIAQPSNATQTLINNAISSFLQGFTSTIPASVLNSFFSGQINITGLTSENGTALSAQDVQRVVAWLQSHPENIVKITFVKQN